MNTSSFALRAALVAAFASASTVFAASSATQAVSIEVAAINEIAVTGVPGALVVNTATAGSQPVAVSDSSTTYAITTNGTSKKITAQIDVAMPTDVTLTAELGAPTGATSAGAVTLGTTAVDAVTAITEVAESSLGISYGLTALVTAGVVPSESKTVTYTIVDTL